MFKLFRLTANEALLVLADRRNKVILILLNFALHSRLLILQYTFLLSFIPSNDYCMIYTRTCLGEFVCTIKEDPINKHFNNEFVSVLFQTIHQELEALGRRIRFKKNVLESFSFTNGITNTRNGKIQSLNPTYKSIQTLEDRWQNLFIRSLEWEVTIEQLLGSYKRLKLLNVSTSTVSINP